jgi:hypothetical protein
VTWAAALARSPSQRGDRKRDLREEFPHWRQAFAEVGRAGAFEAAIVDLVRAAPHNPFRLHKDWQAAGCG